MKKFKVTVKYISFETREEETKQSEIFAEDAQSAINTVLSTIVGEIISTEAIELN